MVVSDQWQRKGIGHHLMRRLMEIARDRGLERMEGEVMRNNFKMLELIQALNFQLRNHPDDKNIMQAEIKLH
jgi:acetyltransferase